MFISVLTLGELDQGVENLSPGDARRRHYAGFRDEVERSFRERTLPVSDEVVRLWGRLRGRRMGAGLGKAPPIDSLLAATAVHHRLYLVTRNVQDMAGLDVVTFDPWTDETISFPIRN